MSVLNSENENSQYLLNDYNNRFSFVILPPWVQDAVTRSGKGPEGMINFDTISSILSRADVETYLALQQYVAVIFSNVLSEDMGRSFRGLFNKNFLTNENRHNPQAEPLTYGHFTQVNDVDHYNKIEARELTDNESFQARLRDFLFYYFADSEMVSDTWDSFYLSVTPLYNDVAAIRIHRADATENVIEKQAQALKDWVMIACKYVPFKTVAKSGLVSAYLRQCSKVETVTGTGIEGFKELIQGVKSIFTKKKPGLLLGGDVSKAYSASERTAKEKLVKTLKELYTNDSWLAKQKFSTTPIPVSTWAIPLSFNGKISDPLKNLEEDNKSFNILVSKWFSYLKTVDQEVQKIYNQTTTASKSSDSDDSVIEIWKKGSDDLKKLWASIDWKKLPSNLPLLGGITFVNGYDKKGNVIGVISSKENNKLNSDAILPLDKAGVKKVAEVLLLILEHKYRDHKGLYLHWLDHSDGNPETNRIRNLSENTYMDFFNEFYYQAANDAFITEIMSYIYNYNLMVALEKLIDGSIV